jgi:hypothetical protein
MAGEGNDQDTTLKLVNYFYLWNGQESRAGISEPNQDWPAMVRRVHAEQRRQACAPDVDVRFRNHLSNRLQLRVDPNPGNQHNKNPDRAERRTLRLPQLLRASYLKPSLPNAVRLPEALDPNPNLPQVARLRHSTQPGHCHPSSRQLFLTKINFPVPKPKISYKN